MENLTPIEHYAQQLREEEKRRKEEKRLKYKIELEGRELINKFASSFSTLFSLLISSNIEINAQPGLTDPAVLLTCKNNQISISPDSATGTVTKWKLFDTNYTATVPNKDFGIASDKTDENKLIIAIAEKLFQAAPAVKNETFDKSPV